jgi:hydroxyethylthiazole kinase
MGTLLPTHADTIPAAVRAAHEAQKVCVLDPVGIGIGSLRTSILQELKPYKPLIIRGNASEIIALAGLWGLEGSLDDLTRAKGVDSMDSVVSAQDAAVLLARYTGGAVAVSGPVDMVTDGTRVVSCHGGSPLMERVTGFGCSLGGVCAVYAAVADPFTAALTAVQHFNVAGERAAALTQAPGTFKTLFLDELYLVSASQIAEQPFEVKEA